MDKNGNNLTEDIELWHRDPVECIKQLMENPAFKNKQSYEPWRVYRRNDYSNREYSEMWTADWWWEMQVRIFFFVNRLF